MHKQDYIRTYSLVFVKLSFYMKILRGSENNEKARFGLLRIGSRENISICFLVQSGEPVRRVALKA